MAGVDGRTLNVLCKEVSLPFKQILTLDHTMGLYQEKIANGFATEDVSMTFYVPNDYAPKKYFDEWRSKIVKEGNNAVVGYKKDYVKDIVIRQLKKPVARFGFDLGPLDINLDVLGKSIYSVKLIEAFPTSLSAIQLTSDQGQFVEFNVRSRTQTGKWSRVKVRDYTRYRSQPWWFNLNYRIHYGITKT